MMKRQLLVGIWTQGHAILRDWLGRLDFPDAFAVGLLQPDRGQPHAGSSALPSSGTVRSLHNIETKGQLPEKYMPSTISDSTFIAFDPDPFFRLTHLDRAHRPSRPGTHGWQRLRKRRPLLSQPRFRPLKHRRPATPSTSSPTASGTHFEIVGVVTNPGLEVVSGSSPSATTSPSRPSTPSSAPARTSRKSSAPSHHQHDPDRPLQGHTDEGRRQDQGHAHGRRPARREAAAKSSFRTSKP